MPLAIRLLPALFGFMIAVFLTAPSAALTPVAPPQLYFDQKWEQIKEAKGDLNGDGIEDRAIILQAPDKETDPPQLCEGEEDYFDAPVRRLLIFLGDKSGSETLAADEQTVIRRRDQGGAFGDPLEDMYIEKGVLVIHHYGGSRWRWGETLRFRKKGDDWHLIGITDWWYDSAYGNNLEYDYNLLSGRMKRTVEFGEAEDRANDNPEPVCGACLIGEDCPEKDGCYNTTKVMSEGAEWFNIGIKPPITLSGYHCWRENPGLLKHLGFQDGN